MRVHVIGTRFDTSARKLRKRPPPPVSSEFDEEVAAAAKLSARAPSRRSAPSRRIARSALHKDSPCDACWCATLHKIGGIAPGSRPPTKSPSRDTSVRHASRPLNRRRLQQVTISSLVFALHTYDFVTKPMQPTAAASGSSCNGACKGIDLPQHARRHPQHLGAALMLTRESMTV